MRWLITSTDVFTYDLSAMVSAILVLFDSDASIHLLASSTAAVIARAVFGYFFTHSAVVPRTFSGWSFQTSWVVVPVMPMPSMMARWFHGSPTQNPSMFPMRMFATICGGGTVMILASFIG